MARPKKEQEQEEQAPAIVVATHDMFMYSKIEGAKLFKEGAIIPDGWYDSQEKARR